MQYNLTIAEETLQFSLTELSIDAKVEEATLIFPITTETVNVSVVEQEPLQFSYNPAILHTSEWPYANSSTTVDVIAGESKFIDTVPAATHWALHWRLVLINVVNNQVADLEINAVRNNDTVFSTIYGRLGNLPTSKYSLNAKLDAGNIVLEMSNNSADLMTAKFIRMTIFQ